MADQPIPTEPQPGTRGTAGPGDRTPTEIEQEAKGFLGGILAGLGCLGFLSLPLLMAAFVLLFILALWGITELYKIFFG